MVAKLLGVLIVQVVLVQLVSHLQPSQKKKNHEGDAVEVRLWRALLTKTVDSRRHAMLHLCWNDVDLAVEETVIDAF